MATDTVKCLGDLKREPLFNLLQKIHTFTIANISYFIPNQKTHDYKEIVVSSIFA